MPKLLLIAYHFPPLAGSSGIQRTLRFAQHLPKFGWEPIVLTTHSRAYERTSDDLLRELPPDLCVRRSFALDTARHLSLFNRYPGFLARPDRWATWRWSAVPAAVGLIEEHKPQAIWSTYPIATAHEIGAAVHRRTGLPWVADFRDPMAQDNYPSDPRVHRAFSRIEKKVFDTAAAAVFTTRGSANIYRQRFPRSSTRIEVIENGYDEESFAGLDTQTREPLVPGKLTILHSGIIYPSERDPRPFLDALAQLMRDRKISDATLRIRLRAPVHEDFLNTEVRARNLQNLVELAPPIPYRQALQEMTHADALLVMQAANCNEQIPAKVYEYLRSGRPVLGLTDPGGDTADLLHRAGLKMIAPLNDAEQIAVVLMQLLQKLNAGQIELPDERMVRDASRVGRTGQLVRLLESL